MKSTASIAAATRATRARTAEPAPAARTQHRGAPARATVEAMPEATPEIGASTAPGALLGNQTLLRMLDRHALQAKLTVNAPGDRFEAEADRVADQVLRMPGPETAPGSTRRPPAVQRMCQDCQDDLQRKEEPDEDPQANARIAQRVREGTAPDDDEQTAQAKAEAGGPSAAPVATEALLRRSSGQPLAPNAAAFLSPRLGCSLDGVRVHTDAAAETAARSIHAQAFTVGRDIYFARGRYQPGTSPGRRLLAHELTHTVQQGAVHHPDGASSGAGVPAAHPGKVAAPVMAQRLVDTASVPRGGDPGRVSADEVLAPNEHDLSQDVSVEDLDLGGADSGGTPGGGAPPGGGAESGAGFSCPDIITPIAEFAGQETPALPETLPFVSVAAALLPFPFNVAAGVAVEVAATAWSAAPLAAKAAAINAMIDLGLEAVPNAPELLPTDKYAKIVLAAFLRRLRTIDDARKVAMAERLGNLILGRDVRFLWGALKGLVVGFLVDGLLGILQMLIDVICLIPMFFQFIDRVLRFLELFPEAVREAIQALVDLKRSVEEALENAIHDLLELYHHPERVVEFLEQIDEQATAAAESMGERGAELMVSLFGASSERMGYAIGRLIGMLLFEIVLAVVAALLTAPAGGSGAAGTAAVSAAKTALRAFIQMLRRAMAQIARLIRPLLRLVTRWADQLKDFVVGLGRVLTRAWGKVAARFGRVIDKLKELFQRFLLLLEDNAQLALFIALVRGVTATIGASGITRVALLGRVTSIQRKPRFVREISLPRVKAADNRGYWIVKAGLQAVPLVRVGIAEAWMDRATRREKAGEFIQDRLDDLSDRRFDDAHIEDEIRPFREPYGFNRLYAEYDPAENDFDVKGAMSPVEEIATKDSPWPSGERDDPVPIRWFRRGDVYPTIKIYRSDPAGGRTLVEEGTLTAGINLPAPGGGSARRLEVAGGNLRPVVAMQKGERTSETVKEQVGRRLRENPDIDVVEPGGAVLGRDRYQIDHVRELALGGDDDYANLWPARNAVNRAFNANFNQKIWIQDSDEITRTRVQAINGKWVKVDDVADSVPLTSGGHGTTDALPINRGQLTGGVRQRFPRTPTPGGP